MNGVNAIDFSLPEDALDDSSSETEESDSSDGEFENGSASSGQNDSSNSSKSSALSDPMSSKSGGENKSPRSPAKNRLLLVDKDNDDIGVASPVKRGRNISFGLHELMNN